MVDLETFISNHVDDYNRHDVDALVSAFAPDVKIHSLDTGKVLMEGRENIRAFYNEKFDYPKLYSDVVERLTIGEKVIDKQIFTSEADTMMIKAVTIYYFKDNLIQDVWFIFE